MQIPNNYNIVLDHFFQLPVEDKEEILQIMEKNIAEERRNEILNNFKQAKNEENNGELSFSSNIENLKLLL
jgi:isopenicillin N synthase-like dioxygenase